MATAFDFNGIRHLQLLFFGMSFITQKAGLTSLIKRSSDLFARCDSLMPDQKPAMA